MQMRRKYSIAIVGGGILTVCLGQTALSDDLESKIKYDQQRTKWKMEETRQKIEADRARMQSHLQSSQSSASRPQSSTAAYGQATASQTAVRQLFQQYKSLDLSNNPQIMNLYANDANINVLGTPYTKAAYTRYVTNAYQHPAGGLNSHTSYSEPVIQATNDSAQVKFAGTLGPATMTVFWTLRRSPNGLWQIASERFVNGKY
jgi:hypothetical protein